MNDYIAQTIARQRMDQAALDARSSHIREVSRTRAGWHLPRLNWHLPVSTRAAGV